MKMVVIMDRNKIMEVLECCVLNLDAHSKEELVEFGITEEMVEMGIDLCDYLKNKKVEDKPFVLGGWTSA